MLPRKKREALEELARQIQACQLCPLFKTANRAVPGEGNPNAEIFFVGEGPGKQEDEQGLPFVGAAGKLLNSLMESIKLRREDVFIGNMVKHRPPGNRDPLPNELHACIPWLERQLEIIKPPLIVTLGRFSMAHFLGEGYSISRIHGQPKRRHGKVILPMYHPAAALYRGELRAVLEADFKKIPKVLKLLKKG
jgi:DNA polymerase